MYLEKLEIQGFKSFAKRYSLVFPGMVDKTKRGITSIVGPNGSGKSNVADSIRWVLGEQSMKTLRGKKSEDVIFSGSDKKAKLGMAEVSLFLNNEDRKVPIDYSELVLTRRLYRDGESEYLINNSRARLQDIQIMLAKANFGQKTYSVIGQGMVEGFLNTSLAERKEFFDEATGVKHFQIKRDASLNKLRSSYENLDQVSMLLTEIEPRLKSLTRQVNKLKRRGEVETELKELQLKYFSKIWHEIKGKFSEYNGKYLELEREKLDKDKKLEKLNSELKKMEEKGVRNHDYDNWQTELSRLQFEKDNLTKQIARLDAQIEMNLEAKGQFDLSWLNNKKEQLERDLNTLQPELDTLNKEIEIEQKRKNELEREKSVLDKKSRELNEKLMSLSNGRKNEIKIDQELKNYLSKLNQINEETEIDKIKILIQEIKKDIQNIIAKYEQGGIEIDREGIESAQKNIIKLSEEREELSGKLNASNLFISNKEEKRRLFAGKSGDIKRELDAINEKLKENEKALDQDELGAKKQNLKNSLKKIEDAFSDIKAKIDKIAEEEEKERSLLFSIQRNIQALQNEINDLSRQLGELKVNSTRYETKLEDLEIEIREALGGLREVKESQPTEVNIEESRNKITDLKHQLELIGGIDPETEKEYNQTKERFDFLSGQVDDLMKAIKSLEEIIKELDITIKERFDEEFKRIQEKFGEYFKILFSGGNAKIVKVMEEDINETTDNRQQTTGNKQHVVEGQNEQEKLEKEAKGDNTDLKRIKFLQKHNATGLAGIEIQATPPGKKISALSMLSGGERALTAIALICAIISANPSPFVVLDEVDAALDEANSERLAKILDDLSHKTQFIAITHNRATMRRANVLYGVTMGDDGISKLLSVKLEDVKTK